MQTEDIKEVLMDNKQVQLHSPQASTGIQQLHPIEHEHPTQEETEYDLSELTISKDALEPIKFDGMEEILKVLHSGVLKGIENPKLRENFVKAITLPRVGKVMRLSFFFILMSNFRECVKFDDEEEILKNVKKRLSKNYVKLFSTIPQPKDEIVNLIIFCLGYANHQLFYHIFPKQRELFDLRFVFNCYHILIFEFNGIFVSDFFVRMNIDKIFQQQKFLDYERVNRKAILQMQEAKSKVKAKTFFGFDLQFPDIASQEGQKFTKQMQDKFKPQKTSLHFQEDFLMDHISSQDKKNKIHSKLKDKRIKQIEESEWKKMLATQNSQNLENQLNPVSFTDRERANTDREKASPDRERTSTDRERANTDRDRIIRKQVVERAEQIFEKTALRTEQDGYISKEDQNYFTNLQLNCNQISPTVSNLLAYETRTLPFEKKKLIRHAFETVNDKQDSLLSQLKQFSQSRKTSKETKLTQKVNKNMIDHFGLRPPPREYYQKHPKLDKLFKDMLDINYVLKCNKESMNQLPSSVQMHSEQANEQQQFILNQERDYNKQNQRQKVQENLNAVVEANQKYQLETRPGFRKKYIYTKPLQYMKKTQSMGQLPLEGILMNIQNNKIASRQDQELNKINKKNEEKMELQGMPSINVIQSIEKLTISGLNGNLSPQKLADKVTQEIGGFVQEDNGQLLSKMGSIVAKKQKVQMQKQLEPMSNRKLEFKVIEIDQKKNNNDNEIKEELKVEKNHNKQSKKQNLMEDNEYYQDNRRVYKQKYKGFIQGMSTDNNIDDILQDILHQRNQFNRGQKSKVKDD